MFDKEDIQHNLKTGADSDIMFTREVTDKKSLDFNKLKTKSGIYKYPFLSRSTGNSIKGMTETIESNELRKGRTKSASRQGNSSAEGSLDIELSPTTFDDTLAAAFRNEWKRWESDTNSAINIDGTVCEPGFFITRCIDELTDHEKNYNLDQSFGKRRLVNYGGKDEGGLINVPAGCVVHELTCGTEDIKYSVLKKFGGKTDEDLYQEYKHMAVNTFSLDVQIGAIVTGSFGFMGNNNPRIMDEKTTRAEFGGTTTDRFEDGAISGNDYIDGLPLKSTDTDQFTSREGNLWINGKNITFAESLSMELNNGLEKKYAIFVKNAISTQPLSLDITGDLKTYLVFGESDELYNLGVDNSTNEIMFCFQDKEYDPTFVYVFQVFKTKIGDQDLSSSGPDTFSQSHPYSSFEERAVRVFRIALPIPTEIEFESATVWTDAGTILIRPNVEVTLEDLTGKIKATSALKNAAGELVGTVQEFGDDAVSITPDGLIAITEQPFSEVIDAIIRDIEVTVNGKTLKKSFGITEKEPPMPITNFSSWPDNKGFSLMWSDPADPDFAEVEIDVLKNNEVIRSVKVEKGVQAANFNKLANGMEYTVNAYAVDKNNNKSKVTTVKCVPAEPSKMSKTLAGKKFTDADGSTYTFDNVNGIAKHCLMNYSVGDVLFNVNVTDEPDSTCIMQNPAYADGVKMTYGYSGAPDTTVTLTLKDPSMPTPMIPSEIVLTASKS